LINCSEAKTGFLWCKLVSKKKDISTVESHDGERRILSYFVGLESPNVRDTKQRKEN